MAQSAFTTVTLRRLPQGESLQIVISADKALSVLKNKTTGQLTPDFNKGEKITVTPKVYGTSGTAANLSSINWRMDGTSISSSIATWDGSTGILTIKGSPIGDTVKPLQLSFSAKAELNGHTYDVEKIVVLNCAEISDNSYWGAIEASNGTTLDANTKETTLTPKLYLGTTEKDSGFNVVWYKTGADNGKDLKLTADNAEAQYVTLSGNTLKVTDKAVESAAHFECHFFVGSTSDPNNEVEAEGVSIVDVMDELQLDVQGDTFASDGGTISLTVKAYSKTSGNKINITSTDQISIVATDSIRQRTMPTSVCSKSISDNCCIINTKEEDWRVPNDNTAKYGAGQYVIVDGQEVSGVKIDKGTNTKSEATKCEAILLIGATIEM